MPDVGVLIAHALDHHETLTLAVVVLAGEGLGAFQPLPRSTNDGANASRHATGSVTGKDVLQLLLRWVAQKRRLALVDHKLGQASRGLGDGGPRQAAILMMAVVRLAIPQHS